MRRDIIVADNFYEDPDAIAQYALSLEYMFPYNKPEDELDGKPIPWRTSKFQKAASCPIKSSKVLIDRLEFLTGERINLDYWNLDFPVDQLGYPVPEFEKINRGCWWNCAFHVKHLDSQRLGEGVHSHTDRDIWSAVGINGWVGLIYLNRNGDLRAGLHTWINKDKDHQHDWMTPRGNWQEVDTLGSVFNRLILHRGGLPHSGAPGWGTKVSDGRLFQTFFFRTLEVSDLPPLSTATGFGFSRRGS
jgi:hypothetical protein